MSYSNKPTATLSHNRELSIIFGKMADCYRYLGNEHRFRANAYETAARTIANLAEAVDVYHHDIRKLDELKGVGESIAAKIIEYLDTGTIRTFETLKTQVPFKLLELMDVEGIGPATIRLLHDQLQVNSVEALGEAIMAGKLHSLKGISSSKIASIKQALKLNPAIKKRMPYKSAKIIADELLQSIMKIPGVLHAAIAGSLRRHKETIGDIDIVITAASSKHKSIVQRFIQLAAVEKVLAAGKTRASVLLKKQAVQADIRVVNEDEYGAAMLYFTGSKEHNIQLRGIAKKRGWKINEYGVFNVADNKKLAGKTEEEIYRLFGLPLIPPQKRIGGNELNSIL